MSTKPAEHGKPETGVSADDAGKGAGAVDGNVNVGSTGASIGASRGVAVDDPDALPPSRAAIDTELKSIITDILGVASEDSTLFTPETGLFGHLPELDSMAVAGLLTEIEDRMGIVIEDDDVDGEMLETYGGLLAFVESKLIED